MHGFLNVLGAAVLAAEHRWDANQTAIICSTKKMRIVIFVHRRFFAWREWRIDTKRPQYRIADSLIVVWRVDGFLMSRAMIFARAEIDRSIGAAASAA